MNSTEIKTREAICRLGASIFGRGLTPGSSGNISVRVDDGWLMTPTNASLGELDPATLSKLDDQGRLVSGNKETKESFLHLAVYDVRANAGAIVHLHSTHSVAVSCLADVNPADVLPPITAYYVMKIGTLPLIPYYRPGDKKLAEAVRAVAHKHHACCWPITVQSSPAARFLPPLRRLKNWRKPPGSICYCTVTRRAFSHPSRSRSCTKHFLPDPTERCE